MDKQTEYAFDVVEYILSDDREEQDFNENPSENHVYFKAVAAVDGVKIAKALLSITKRKLEATQ